MSRNSKVLLAKMMILFIFSFIGGSTCFNSVDAPEPSSLNFNLKSLICDNGEIPCALSQNLTDGALNLDGLHTDTLEFHPNADVNTVKHSSQPDRKVEHQIHNEPFDIQQKILKTSQDPENYLQHQDRYQKSFNETKETNLSVKTTVLRTQPVKYANQLHIESENTKFLAQNPIFWLVKSGRWEHGKNLVPDDPLINEVDFESQIKRRKPRSTDEEVSNQNKDAENKTETQEVLDLLQEGERKQQFEFHKDAVLVMGNTGSGKSTFTQFIAGNDGTLISYETLESSGDFIIKDISGKISNTSTITSWTIFPELVIDKKTNTKFYDCPGFSDTRGVAHDIAATYFTKEILKNTDRIKLLFIINYSSVRIGVDRLDFMMFAKHVVTAVQNIDKFNESIALVVTKVDNQHRGGVLVPDEKVIQSIAGFLKVAKSEIQRKIQPTHTKEVYEKIVKFIDILLQQNGSSYPKIGIFRRPDNIGPLSELAVLQSGKKTLEKIVYRNIEYTEHTEKDFAYTISAESKNRIHTLVEQLKDNIASEILQVANELKQHFSEREGKMNDIQTLFEQFHHEYESFSAMKMTIIRPHDFINLIEKNINDLSFTIQSKNLRSIAQYDRFLEFFITFGARVIKPIEWTQGYTILTEHLKDSANWYKFLIQLFSVLSKYNVQQNENLDLVGEFAHQVNISGNHEEQRLERFMELLQEKIGDTSEIIIAYERVKNLEHSKVKLVKLEMLLQQVIESKVKSFCNEDNRKLTLKGQFVKLSSVPMMLENFCSYARFVEIFALEKVFIDGDLNLLGKEAQVSIIAPKWEVRDRYKIILDGAEGEERSSDLPFFHGKAGLNGHPAGRFFGIGHEFVDSELLSISAIGGTGGRGQDGRTGSKGKDGSIPQYYHTHSMYNDCQAGERAKGFWNFVFKILPFTDYVKESEVCTVEGTECSDGEDGGNGGVGGKGGKAGEIMMIGMNYSPNFFAFDGKNGKDGSGGRGGWSGQPGKGRKFEKYRTYKQDYWRYDMVNEWNLRWCYSGAPGEPGNSYRDIQELNDNQGFISLPAIINSYKAFARENLSPNVRQKNLQTFLDEKLENDDSVVNLYDTTGFLDELRHLENQFYELRRQIPFSPLYNSLLHRIRKYAKKMYKTKQNIKVLSYLYAATLSKICSIHNNQAEDLVTDVKLFLDTAGKDIENLKDAGKIVETNRYFTMYNESLFKRISETQYFVEEQVNIDLRNLFANVNFQMEDLIIKTINQKNNVEQNIHVNKMKQDFENNLVLRKMLSVVEVANMFLGFAVSTGEATIAAIGGSAMIEENMELGDKIVKGKEYILVFVHAINNATSPLKNKLESKKQNIKDELRNAENVINSFLKLNSSTDIPETEILDTYRHFIGSMDDREIFDLAFIDEMFETRNHVKVLLNNKTDPSNANEPEVYEISRKKENFKKRIESAVNAPDLGIDILSEFEENFAVIENLGGVLQQVRPKIEKLTEFEQNIFKSIITPYKMVWENVKQAENEFQTSSYISLAPSQWQFRDALGNVKSIIQKMTQEFQISEKVIDCTHELEESLSITVGIYDRLQNYYENAELAAYITDITSKNALNIEMRSPESIQGINDLQLRIQTNLILKEYETALNAFNQHVFPFASLYQPLFELPTYFHTNDTSSLVLEITTRIEEMKNISTNSSQGSINHDKYLRTNVLFDGDSHNMPPFFVWQYSTNANKISELLEGKKVTMKADVTHGLKENAIKFSDVGIRFKLWDTTLQQEMDKILLNFNVTMTHFGHAYYRCDDRFYVITSPQQAISYSFVKHNENEVPQDENSDNLIINDDPILSPYTLWTLQLTSNSGFSALTDFKSHEMDLELHGRGQYMNTGENICTDDLERFYTVDKTVSQINDQIRF